MNIHIQAKDRDLELYPQSINLLPEITSVGKGLFHRAVPGGPRPDGITDVFEICFIAEGSAEWWLDDELHEIGAGYSFINRPGEWHGGRHAMLHPCTVFWLQIVLDKDRPVPFMSKDDAIKLADDFKQFEHRFFPASSAVPTHFKTILAEYRQPGQYATLIARSALHGLLGQTIRDQVEFAREHAEPYSSAICKGLAWMEDHLTDPFTMEDVAQAAGVSPGYFYRLFLEEMGTSPNEYRLRQRVTLAKRYLRVGDHSITAIAHALGFSSSQYFATTFKKVAGMSPSQYKRLALAQLKADST